MKFFDPLNQRQLSPNPQLAGALPNQPQPLPFQQPTQPIAQPTQPLTPQPLNPQQPAIAQPPLVKANEVPTPTRGRLIYQQTFTLAEFMNATQLGSIHICPTINGKWAFCDLTKPVENQIIGPVANSAVNKGYTSEQLRISFCVDSITGETTNMLHVKREAMVSHQQLM